MTEDVSLVNIRAIKEVIEQNLKIVQQALGIEAANDNDLGELEAEPEIVTETAIGNFPKKRMSATELDEEKSYWLAMRNTRQTQFLKSQAMFVESVAKFNASRNKFIKKRKQGNFA